MLIANEIVTADKCARVAALARRVAITVGRRFVGRGSRRWRARRGPPA